MLTNNTYLLTLFVAIITQFCETIFGDLAEIVTRGELETSKLDWLSIFRKAVKRSFWGELFWGNFLYLLFVKNSADLHGILLGCFVGLLLMDTVWMIFRFIRSKLFPPEKSSNL
jgi:hypothetical protein